MDHPPLTGYWTDLVRFTVTLIGQIVIPTETVGVLKQAGKFNADHKGRRPPGDKDDGSARQQNTRGQKQFPSDVRPLPEHK